MDLARPLPRKGEVLVRMLAAPVNPSDRLFIEGQYGADPLLPSGAGFEGAGIVESSGGGALGKFLLGRRVCVLDRTGGTWATHVVVGARSVIPVPRELAVEQAATFFVNPATAFLLTRRVHRPASGEWFLQSAGASSVGKMIVALGRHFGFRTISLVRREVQMEQLERLGADSVILWDGSQTPETLREHVSKTTGGAPVRYGIDPVGGATGSAMLSCLGNGGQLVVYGTLSHEPLTVSSRDLIARELSLSSFWLGPYMDRLSLLGKLRLIRSLTKLSRSGVLTVETGPSFPLDAVKDAVRASEHSPHGKVLLRMD